MTVTVLLLVLAVLAAVALRQIRAHRRLRAELTLLNLDHLDTTGWTITVDVLIDVRLQALMSHRDGDQAVVTAKTVLDLRDEIGAVVSALERGERLVSLDGQGLAAGTFMSSAMGGDFA